MSRGWCPTVHAPMLVSDGWLVRIKPPASHLSRIQGLAVADAATRWGNGHIDLTSRANLQLRGVIDAPALAQAMVAHGLSDPDPAREARRNVVLAPCAGPHAERVAHALETALAEASPLAALPEKFGFSVDAGPCGLGGHRADIALMVDDGIHLAADGGPWCRGTVTDAIALAHAFLAMRHPGERRMRAVVARGGAAPLYEACGLHPCPAADPPRETFADIAPVDGRLDAAALRALCETAPDGLHLTTRRSLLPAARARAAA